MSVPTVAATLADSLKPIMDEMIRSLGCRVLQISMNTDGLACVYVHDAAGECVQGISRETFSRALHDANSERQAREEAKAAAQVLPELAA